MIKAHILTIGDELLIGQTVDTNSAWLGKALNDIGVWVYSRSAVGDTEEGIIEGIDYGLSKADIVIITGGLGPTKDDITKHTLCRYFSSTLILNREVLDNVTALFAKLNRPMIERNRLQAMVPDNCTILPNRQGTAPGMWFEYQGKVVISMPGVPFEMRGITEDEVIPRLKQRFNTTPVLHKSFLTIGIGESFLAEHIHEFEEALPSYIKLAYLPHLSQVRLRLTATGVSEDVLVPALKQHGDTLRELIKEYYAGEDDDTIETAIAKLLVIHSKKLALAESCTGGYIANMFTRHPRASAYFEGSMVTYSYEAKEEILGVPHELLLKYGAVSEECVRTMAEAARTRLKADYSIAVSGIAGPDGGTPDKPVGTVWIAVSSAQHTKTLRANFFRSRQLNIESTAITAMIHLYRMLKKELE